MSISSALPQSHNIQNSASGVASSRANTVREGVNDQVSETKQLNRPVDNSQVGFTVTNPNNPASSANEATQQSTHTPRLDIDEQALAVAVEQLGLLEPQQPSSGLVAQDSSRNSNSSSNSYANNSGYDSADQNRTAVSAYQSVGNQAARESVQQVFGVDLFA